MSISAQALQNAQELERLIPKMRRFADATAGARVDEDIDPEGSRELLVGMLNCGPEELRARSGHGDDAEYWRKELGLLECGGVLTGREIDQRTTAIGPDALHAL